MGFGDVKASALGEIYKSRNCFQNEVGGKQYLDSLQRKVRREEHKNPNYWCAIPDSSPALLEWQYFSVTSVYSILSPNGFCKGPTDLYQTLSQWAELLASRLCTKRWRWVFCLGSVGAKINYRALLQKRTGRKAEAGEQEEGEHFCFQELYEQKKQLGLCFLPLDST